MLINPPHNAYSIYSIIHRFFYILNNSIYRHLFSFSGFWFLLLCLLLCLLDSLALAHPKTQPQQQREKDKDKDKQKQAQQQPQPAIQQAQAIQQMRTPTPPLAETMQRAPPQPEKSGETTSATPIDTMKKLPP
ncbi:MAG: hypothetical protein QXK11_07105, partial [Pyrobaculum sp.]